MANQKPEKTNARWSKADDKRLIELAKQGSTTAAIAIELGRTRSSIWARKYQLDLGNVRLQPSRGTNVPASYSTRTRKEKPAAVEAAAIPVEVVKTRKSNKTSYISNEINLENAAKIAKKHGLNLTVITFHS